MLNSADLLQTVIKVITNVPKKELKVNFVRHCSTLRDNKLVKSVNADWKRFSSCYKQFKSEFSSKIDEDTFLQKIFVQLATVSVLLGNVAPEEDSLGIYAGCALFISEWCQFLSRYLFPDCPPYTFYAIWSPLLKTFGVDWAFHGFSSTVLMALDQVVAGDEDEEQIDAYPLNFPGPAPMISEEGLEVCSWSQHFNTLTSEIVRSQFNTIFGYAHTNKKIPSKHVTYFNPSDETFSPHRSYNNIWAIDTLPSSPEIEEFEEDGEEEDTNEFKEDMAKLTSMLCDNKTK